MLELFIQDKIVSFVKTFQVVKEDQIIRFFSDHDMIDVSYELKGLKTGKRLFELPDGRISTTRNLNDSLSKYDLRIDALEAMCLLRSKEVDWMCPMPYPIDIMFGTSDNVVYDVTAFPDSWQAKYSLTGLVRDSLRPPDEEDHVKHIAVVRNEQTIFKIKPLGFYMYVVLYPDGRIETYK